MISVKKVNNKDIVVNCELIQMVEWGHDTVIVLTNGEKLIVSDSAEEIIRKVIDYRKAVNCSGIDVKIYEPRSVEEIEVPLTDGDGRVSGVDRRPDGTEDTL